MNEHLFRPPDSPYLVPFDGSFELAAQPTSPTKAEAADQKLLKRDLAYLVSRISDFQRALYAENRRALLLVFQAMDAAGKDSTIRKVLSGVNPAGCQVVSFKQPSSRELEHHLLWRTTRQLPPRGTIGVFNRSYYEEVLVVRVHPNLLEHQNLPAIPTEEEELDALWQHRYAAICEHERLLAHAGTVVLKFWLNVSRDEQKKRFLSRLNEPHKHWKFSTSDVRERGLWPKYMEAYEGALAATSRPWAPWYAIPADDKRFMRREVARIVEKTLEELDPQFPAVEAEEKDRFAEMRRMLKEEKH